MPTNSMQQSSAGEPNTCSTSQQIPHVLQAEDPLLCSQKPATDLCQIKSIPSHPFLLQIILTLSHHPHPGLQECLFPSGFSD